MVRTSEDTLYEESTYHYLLVLLFRVLLAHITKGILKGRGDEVRDCVGGLYSNLFEKVFVDEPNQ
jgi:hypothetical protein